MEAQVGWLMKQRLGVCVRGVVCWLSHRFVFNQLSYTAQFHMPKEWCLPQLARPSSVSEQLRHSLTDVPIGQSGPGKSFVKTPISVASHHVTLSVKE